MSQSPQAPESIEITPDRLGPSWLERCARIALWVYWPSLAVGTHWPNLKLPQQPGHALEDVLQIDKAAHTIGFGGLMVLVLLAGLGGWGLRWSVRCAIALGVCLAYAVIDELTQGLMGGRTVSWADLITNVTAVLAVYLIASQPRRREPKRVPWWVVVPMLLLLPVLLFALLSPWAMSELIELKRVWVSPKIPQPARDDYIGHGIIAFFASAIVFTIWPRIAKRPRLAALIAIMMLLASGPGIEVLQHFTGRGVQGEDVLGHTIGVLIAMTIWALWQNRHVTIFPSRKSAALETDIDAYEVPSNASPGFVGHAVLVSVFTLLSRFAGLARDAILAAALGLSVAADAFFIGFLVPNLFRRLFGEGALTAAFIPNYTDLLERDPGLAKRFATLTLTLLSVVLVSLTLIAELVLWSIASNMDESHKASLAIYYTRLMLPYMPLICAVAFIGGVLQVHKRFGPPAAAPLVLNGVTVLAVLLATWFFTYEAEPVRVATWVAISVVIAGVLQLLWQIVVLLRVTGLARSFSGCWPTMRSMLLMMGPMVLGLAVFQINALMDALIAFFFAPSQAGSGASQQLSMFGQTFDAPLRNGDVAALNWSQRLYQFPLGVFGIAIATAIFPALSAAAAKFANANPSDLDERGLAGAKPNAVSDEFANIVRHGLRLTVFIALPASVGLILVRVPLARTVFEHGSFTSDDALRVSVILAGYASSVWAYSMTHTLTRAFYALKDATTPLKISAAMVLLNITLNLSLIWSLGAAGLAWSTAISAAGQVALLILLLRKRVARPIDDSVISSWTRTMIASTIMAIILFAITYYIDPLSLTWGQSAGLLAVMVAVGIGVFFIIAKLAKAQELSWLRKRSVK